MFKLKTEGKVDNKNLYNNIALTFEIYKTTLNLNYFFYELLILNMLNNNNQ